MILRFLFGLSALAVTFAVYFVVTTAETSSATEENMFQQDWQTTLCTPEDQLLGELLLLDPDDSLSVMAVDDEAFAWGLLAPETSVFVNYTAPALSSKIQQPISQQCEVAFVVDADHPSITQHPQQCFHLYYLESRGQAQ